MHRYEQGKLALVPHGLIFQIAVFLADPQPGLGHLYGRIPFVDVQCAACTHLRWPTYRGLELGLCGLKDGLRSVPCQLQKGGSNFIHCMFLDAAARIAAWEGCKLEVNQLMDNGKFHIRKHGVIGKPIVHGGQHIDRCLLDIGIPVDIPERFGLESVGTHNLRTYDPIIEVHTFLPGAKSFLDESGNFLLPAR